MDCQNLGQVFVEENVEEEKRLLVVENLDYSLEVEV